MPCECKQVMSTKAEPLGHQGLGSFLDTRSRLTHLLVLAAHASTLAKRALSTFLERMRIFGQDKPDP